MRSSIILTSLFIVLLSNCKKDSDPKPTTSTLILGTWLVDSEAWSNCTVASGNYLETYSCATYCTKYTFTNDGHCTFQEFTDGNTLVDNGKNTYSIGGTQLVLNDVVYTITIKGSVMTWVGSDQGCTYTLVLSKQ